MGNGGTSSVWWFLGWLLFIGGWAPGAGAQTSPPVEAEAPASQAIVESREIKPLDADALGRRLKDDGVDLKRADPSWAEYAGYVGQRFGAAASSRVEGGVRRWAPWLVELFDGLVLLLLALCGGVLTFFLGRFLWRRLQAVDADEPEPAPTPELEPVVEGTASWARRLEEHLAAGRGAEALQALWWWWASFLKVDEADPAWTTRELILKARRLDLRPLARRFDYLAYGRRDVSCDEVAELWRRLQGAES